MCKLSGKIKFCTCSGDQVDRKGSYWVYYKYNREKDMMMIGTLRMPYEMEERTDAHNRELLLAAMNDLSSFDFECQPKNHDRFLVSIKCPGDEDARLNYGFEFSKGKWKVKDFHVFEWEEEHDPASQGRIKVSFKKSSPD